MVTHLHSTLSDEGIDDDDLRHAELKRHNDIWSHGSIGPPSSPAQSNAQEVRWQFQEDAPPHAFSSAQPNDEQLPKTVPIPSQLEEIRDGAIRSTQKRDYLDFSETCSTTRRSTPFNGEELDHPWDFVHEQSDMSQLSASEDVEEAAASNAEHTGKAPKDAPAAQKKKPQQQQKKPYNTRSQPNISYADGESSSSEDGDSEAAISPRAVPQAPANKSKKKVSPAKDNAPKSAKKTSPKDKQSGERVASVSPQTAEKRKKRQRRKTPLPIDDETQIVQTTLPATPPVSEQRPRKKQKRQPRRAPAAAKPKPRTKNKDPENASPAPITNITSPELGSGHPADVPSSAGSERRRSARHVHPPVIAIDGDDEEENESSEAESTHSTEMTTPSALPNLRRMSSMQVPVPSHQPLPLPPSPPSVFEEVQDSIETIPATRPPFIGEMPALMSRNVSRRDEDISHRLQEIHKRVGLYLQDKEKQVGSVAATYLKNGMCCVDRLQNRFTKERHSLFRKLHDDRDTFNKSLGTAKRGLREGARDRQRVLKELDRNAKKRQHACSNEISRITDISKRIQTEG